MASLPEVNITCHSLELFWSVSDETKDTVKSRVGWGLRFWESEWGEERLLGTLHYLEGTPSRLGFWGAGPRKLDWQVWVAAGLPALLTHRWAEQGWEAR